MQKNRLQIKKCRVAAEMCETCHAPKCSLSFHSSYPVGKYPGCTSHGAAMPCRRRHQEKKADSLFARAHIYRVTTESSPACASTPKF
eukprot:236310-Pyramimonas_sp.AAC.1